MWARSVDSLSNILCQLASRAVVFYKSCSWHEPNRMTGCGVLFHIWNLQPHPGEAGAGRRRVRPSRVVGSGGRPVDLPVFQTHDCSRLSATRACGPPLLTRCTATTSAPCRANHTPAAPTARV